MVLHTTDPCVQLYTANYLHEVGVCDYSLCVHLLIVLVDNKRRTRCPKARGILFGDTKATKCYQLSKIQVSINFARQFSVIQHT